MYTLLNNSEASKFDLYLPGKLVASLHYTISSDEIMFVYCEAIEPIDSEKHCRELMARALEDTLNRRLPITVTCPIARQHMDKDSDIRVHLPVLPKHKQQTETAQQTERTMPSAHSRGQTEVD